MRFFLRITSNIVFSIHVMIFFLLIFEGRIVLPAWLQAFGRMHPLLLHLPIGLLIMAGLLWVTKRRFFSENFSSLFNFILHFTALTASLTALMGFFLSREGGYVESILLLHKWTGVALSLLTYMLLIIYNFPARKKVAFNITFATSIIVLVIAGHFGSSLTHGQGFVWEPLKGEEPGEKIVITDSTPLFIAAIRPILKTKCFSCHNEKKVKGKLIMTSDKQLLKGGKNGPIWVAGDPLNSHIIQKILLPEEEEKHMPPIDKPQLSQEEIRLLFNWIKSGADMKKGWKEYPEDDSVRIYATAIINATHEMEEPKITYSFEEVSASVLQKLNDPFRQVSPLAQGSPAVTASFFIRQNFTRKKLEELSSVKEQLVELNLSNMPVTDNDVPLIAGFPNLEKLFLNNTDITGKNLDALKSLEKLHSLSLIGTKVDKRLISSLAVLPALKEVFVWNTGLSEADISALRKKFPDVSVYQGFQPDPTEVLKLTPPLLVNEATVLEANEEVILKHNLPGAIIRFTTDGSVPDSNTTTIYQSPFAANGFVVVKARAVMNQWFSSDVVEFYLFKKGVQPQQVELINDADEKYKGEGAGSLIDNRKGFADNFNDAAWLGFRKKPFAAWFYFEQPEVINSISVSYGKNIQAYIFPPVEFEVWGGNEKTNLTLVKKISLPIVKKDEAGVLSMGGFKIDIPGSKYRWYKLIAKNISKLPGWHPGKGQSGWVFIDEIFFNE